ncbi:MAG: adenylate kinase [Dehalococcoidia bacterium]|nr:adenylate kinase [Dehalococcoidia bacterium]MDP6227838.1 adenylate kinase [Dehalococcoidia bacterium]MDP7082862.1 adenylate kinase [Dehalococcoidia bacterium]MDP7200143.1 adenylate kinase [Dehalococcoidia bacterium]MDP7509678.1 adenylate kinase [Dehalococcoidia bacterium]
MIPATRLILFGPPGAGKGTQAQLLTRRLRIRYIGSGGLFREHLQQQTALGLQVAGFMNQGLLVPDEVTIDIILDKVLSLEPRVGFILDGFPRNLHQARALEWALEQRSRGLDKVVHIDVPEREVFRRIGGRYSCRRCQAPHTIGLPSPDEGSEEASKETSGKGERRCHDCGGELYQRADDTPEALRRRLYVYHTETVPLLSFYQQRGLLADIPGEGSVESIHALVLKAIAQGPVSKAGFSR